MRLIDADALKIAIHRHENRGLPLDTVIDNAPTVKPCENCDLYFKAMTKEEMRKGSAK
jgi:hypothetical protein